MRQGQEAGPDHLRTGERGELLAYYYLRQIGYTVVARRWRSARLRGDLDLVAWDGDTLVAVEVKTRTAHDLAPAHVAVDRHKRQMLRRMLRVYQRQLPAAWQEVVPLRFDVLSVYDLPGSLEFDLFPGAFGLQESEAQGWAR